MRSSRLITFIAFLGIVAPWVLVPGTVHGICQGNALDPQNDVCWDCIFPIKIAGMTIEEGNAMNGEAPSSADASYCSCPLPSPPYIRYGITASLWEPSRMIETVKDPYCFPALGMSMGNNGKNSYLRGTHAHVQGKGGEAQDASVFAQAHWWIMPFWTIMGVMVDSKCMEQSDTDVAYLSEVDPFWQDDEMSAIFQVEALLFANLVAQLACIADAVASQYLPLSPLFWCMGSWGSAYPLTGHINDNDYVQGNAAVAGRLLYKLSRQQLICDPGLWYCYCVQSPIWTKHNYRIQIARPMADFMCHPLGRSAMLWEYLKNPPYSGSSGTEGNFLWIITRKRDCCMSGS